MKALVVGIVAAVVDVAIRLWPRRRRARACEHVWIKTSEFEEHPAFTFRPVTFWACSRCDARRIGSRDASDIGELP